MYFKLQGSLRLTLLTFVAVLSYATAASGQAEPVTIDPFNNRHALVIGNGAYRTAPLKNPVNDATDMASALRSVGFKVTLGNNLGVRQMRLTIQQFVSSLPPGGGRLRFLCWTWGSTRRSKLLAACGCGGSGICASRLG
jgi:hypothetical protein